MNTVTTMSTHTPPTEKKCILVDVVNQTVSESTIGDYEDIYRLIGNGCELFCIPIEFENGDSLFSDDEGLLHEEVHGCFMLNGWTIPLVGNAVILGSDEEGDSVDCLTTVEEIQSQIKFYSKEIAEQWRSISLSTPPVIIPL